MVEVVSLIFFLFYPYNDEKLSINSSDTNASLSIEFQDYIIVI